MKKFFYTLLIPAILAGCKDFKKSIDDTLSDSSSQQSAESGLMGETITHRSRAAQNPLKEQTEAFMFQEEKLEQAEQQLRGLPQFKGKSIFIYKMIHFYADGRIITKLQNPENPDFVDEYTYRHDVWETPKPVILSKNDQVQAALISLDKIPFKNAGHVYNVLIEKGKEIGSTAVNPTIYAVKNGDRINWHPQSIDNSRYEYDIDYHNNGTLKSFEQK